MEGDSEPLAPEEVEASECEEDEEEEEEEEEDEQDDGEEEHIKQGEATCGIIWVYMNKLFQVCKFNSQSQSVCVCVCVCLCRIVRDPTG